MTVRRRNPQAALELRRAMLYCSVMAVPHRHHALAAAPRPSLLRLGAAERLAGVAVVLAVMWALVLAVIA